MFRLRLSPETSRYSKLPDEMAASTQASPNYHDLQCADKKDIYSYQAKLTSKKDEIESVGEVSTKVLSTESSKQAYAEGKDSNLTDKMPQHFERVVCEEVFGNSSLTEPTEQTDIESRNQTTKMQQSRDSARSELTYTQISYQVPIKQTDAKRRYSIQTDITPKSLNTGSYKKLPTNSSLTKLSENANANCKDSSQTERKLQSFDAAPYKLSSTFVEVPINQEDPNFRNSFQTDITTPLSSDRAIYEEISTNSFIAQPKYSRQTEITPQLLYAAPYCKQAFTDKSMKELEEQEIAEHRDSNQTEIDLQSFDTALYKLPSTSSKVPINQEDPNFRNSFQTDAKPFSLDRAICAPASTDKPFTKPVEQVITERRYLNQTETMSQPYIDRVICEQASLDKPLTGPVALAKADCRYSNQTETKPQSVDATMLYEMPEIFYKLPIRQKNANHGYLNQTDPELKFVDEVSCQQDFTQISSISTVELTNKRPRYSRPTKTTRQFFDAVPCQLAFLPVSNTEPEKPKGNLKRKYSSQTETTIQSFHTAPCCQLVSTQNPYVEQVDEMSKYPSQSDSTLHSHDIATSEQLSTQNFHTEPAEQANTKSTSSNQCNLKQQFLQSLLFQQLHTQNDQADIICRYPIQTETSLQSFPLVPCPQVTTPNSYTESFEQTDGKRRYSSQTESTPQSYYTSPCCQLESQKIYNPEHVEQADTENRPSSQTESTLHSLDSVTFEQAFTQNSNPESVEQANSECRYSDQTESTLQSFSSALCCQLESGQDSYTDPFDLTEGKFRYSRQTESTSQSYYSVSCCQPESTLSSNKESTEQKDSKSSSQFDTTLHFYETVPCQYLNSQNFDSEHVKQGNSNRRFSNLSDSTLQFFCGQHSSMTFRRACFGEKFIGSRRSYKDRFCRGYVLPRIFYSAPFYTLLIVLAIYFYYYNAYLLC